MADYKTWRCFIIGDKERAEEQAGGGPAGPQVGAAGAACAPLPRGIAVSRARAPCSHPSLSSCTRVPL